MNEIFRFYCSECLITFDIKKIIGNQLANLKARVAAIEL